MSFHLREFNSNNKKNNKELVDTNNQHDIIKLAETLNK